MSKKPIMQAPATLPVSASDVMTPERIIAWLRANPDFFARYPEALYDMQAPAANHGENISDFQHFMTERLREDRNLLEDQLGELVTISRSNFHNTGRIHASVLALLAAKSLAEMIQCITTDLCVILDVDAASLVVESNGQDHPHIHESGIRVLPPGTVEEILQGRATLLEAKCKADARVFGSATDLVKSQALVALRLSADTPPALLAFGSRNPEAFDARQGTELVGFLARVLENLLARWLDLA